MENKWLTPIQSLATSGARAVESFAIDGARYLVIAQLARDIPGSPAHMNGGDSDIEAQRFRWTDDAFVAAGTLPLAGGEDVEYFEIGARRFLATAGIRSGKGPYAYDCEAIVYEWIGERWVPLQRIPTFAAKQWRAFSIDERYFLALAQGVAIDGVAPEHPRTSRIFEWDGERFAPHQDVGGLWGYDWIHASFGREHYVAYADHVCGSTIYRWNGASFESFQTFHEKGGRTFRFFEADDAWWMVHVNLLSHTTLYRFDGVRFVETQRLGDAGCRELCMIDGERGRYLLCLRFITGTPQAPVVETESELFRWAGAGFDRIETLATSAATDATTFVEGGRRYVVVSNSLSRDLRFGTTSTVYRFHG
ncbi:hypothetical protein [Trinickia acidisoli]|uniref:hypothetical protein n=1 Tax=Trinickia acidisoli TaxID=2767482 RepID=UPI001A90986D|nr:hypothetical protein [Trinickia acidisoli]